MAASLVTVQRTKIVPFVTVDVGGVIEVGVDGICFICILLAALQGLQPAALHALAL